MFIYSQLIFDTMLRFHTESFNSSTHLALTPSQSRCANMATANNTFLHLITLIALKRVEEGSVERLRGEVVTGTIWVKPCNLNHGYSSALAVACSPACSPEFAQLLLLTYWNAK